MPSRTPIVAGNWKMNTTAETARALLEGIKAGGIDGVEGVEKVIMLVEKERSQRWYERWYVWVGVGAVLGGGILTYQYMSREPETVRGF